MAEETVPSRSLGWWKALRLGAIGPRHAAIALTVLFFPLTFLIYHLTDQGPTGFNVPVLLADALLHGRLDIANGEQLTNMDWAVNKGKFYMVEPPMTALVVLPGVLFWGIALNQTLVSVTIGSLSASAVHRLLAGLGKRLSTQVWLTVLFMFGTMYWWNATNGGVWYFAHTLAVLFLFLAVYVTLVHRNPFLAGLLLGAAFLTRIPTIMTLPFFLIMFSDQWLRPSEGRPLFKRIDLKPLLKLGVGLAIFFIPDAIYNYLLFDTPLPASYHYWYAYHRPGLSSDFFNHGLLDIRYIPRHVDVAFKALPIFQGSKPFVVIPQGGMAIWATSPAFIYALFVGMRGKRVLAIALGLLTAGLMVGLVFARGMPHFISRFASDFPTGLNFPYGIELMPFILLIALAVFVGLRNRDKLVVACWAAIIPTALTHFTVAVTGWPQFGYRFALDYYPFLFLLVVKGMGDDLKWYHKLLIVVSVAINLLGVLWWYKFAPNDALGVPWLSW